MKINFPVAAEARGEGLLLKTARAMEMPGLRVASIDGGVSHSYLTTSIRRGRADHALQKFRINLQNNGFVQISLRPSDPEGSVVMYCQARQVYAVLSFTRSFVDIKLEFLATSTKTG